MMDNANNNRAILKIRRNPDLPSSFTETLKIFSSFSIIHQYALANNTLCVEGLPVNIH